MKSSLTSSDQDRLSCKLIKAEGVRNLNRTIVLVFWNGHLGADCGTDKSTEHRTRAEAVRETDIGGCCNKDYSYPKAPNF